MTTERMLLPMNRARKASLSSLACLVAGCAVFFAAPTAAAQEGYLRGKVEERSVIRTARPTSPSGAQDLGDPFSGGGGGDPVSPEDTAMIGPYPAAGKGSPADSFSGFQPPPQKPAPRTGQASKGDPDRSAEMQVAWDAWHQRVAQALFERFNFMSRAAFKYSPPLACKVGYTVTRDGQVKDVKVLEPSTDVAFNVLVTTALKSISGNKDLLQFPLGSRRLEVEKTGTFTQNYGVEGFRYATGDKEPVRAKGHQ